MTYKMTLLNGTKIDIICPSCNSDEFRSQGPRKHLYHMFQCKKCKKCHSRFLNTGKIVIGGKEKWEYGFQEPLKEECLYLSPTKDNDLGLTKEEEKEILAFLETHSDYQKISIGREKTVEEISNI